MVVGRVEPEVSDDGEDGAGDDYYDHESYEYGPGVVFSGYHCKTPFLGRYRMQVCGDLGVMAREMEYFRNIFGDWDVFWRIGGNKARSKRT